MFWVVGLRSRRNLLVIRRCPALIFAASAALVLAGRLTPVSAASTTGTATYTLTAPDGLPPADPSSSGPQVVAQITPLGSVVPPTLPNGDEGSPLTILPDSHGFDQANLVVGLKDNTSPPQQLLGLAFDGSGLAAGGLLHFSLSIDKSLTTPPALESLTPGVTIVSDPTTPTNPPTGGGPTEVNTPEPLSVLLWSLLAGLGLVRARAVRRSRVTPA
jgi:hypothetical protein